VRAQTSATTLLARVRRFEWMAFAGFWKIHSGTR
jgi:hypothetical protein